MATSAEKSIMRKRFPQLSDESKLRTKILLPLIVIKASRFRKYLMVKTVNGSAVQIEWASEPLLVVQSLWRKWCLWSQARYCGCSGVGKETSGTVPQLWPEFNVIKQWEFWMRDKNVVFLLAAGTFLFYLYSCDVACEPMGPVLSIFSRNALVSSIIWTSVLDVKLPLIASFIVKACAEAVSHEDFLHLNRLTWSSQC